MSSDGTAVAGSVLVPANEDRDWQSARLLVGKDAQGRFRIAAVDAQGNLQTSTILEVSDIQIGAVEIKDHNSGVRVDIAADGAANAMFVQSNSLATQVTLAALLVRANLLATEATVGTLATQATAAAILARANLLGTQVTLATRASEATLANVYTRQADKTQMAQITDGTNEADVIATILSLKTDTSSVAGTATPTSSGNLAAGVQRVCIATDDVNLSAMLTALQLIDNIVGTQGGAAPAGFAVVGTIAETTVPTAVTDGQPVRLWADEYGRIKPHGTNLSEGSINTTDVSPAVMQVIEAPFTQLTAPGSTPSANVQDFHYMTYQILFDIGGCTNAVVRADGSMDDTNWAPLGLVDDDNAVTACAVANELMTLTASGVFYLRVRVLKTQYIRFTFVSELDDTDCTIDLILMAGN